MSCNNNFIVASQQKPTKDDILNALGVPVDSILYDLALEVATCLTNVKEIKQIPDYISNEIKQYIKNNDFKIYTGIASDSCSDPNSCPYLSYDKIIYMNSNIAIETEAPRYDEEDWKWWGEEEKNKKWTFK